ncbi:MAG TPA: ribosome silencing factor [Acidimicrobiales bacterium]|nr:ribosome silencing factor [Acidimicrobiales bacterium]
MRTSSDIQPPVALIAARAAASKKAIDPVVLDVSPLLGITDSFVIASAGNPRLVRTIADEVEKQVKEAGGGAPLRVEGLDDARWVLLDYGATVVHVFLDEAREFYDLERLWSTATRVDWDEAERVGAGERL